MKRKAHEPASKPFRLSSKAKKKLNAYLAEIRKGITNVCELHTHDSSPSMSQSEFEEAIIEKILAQTAIAVSLSIKAMTDGLAAQKGKELRKILQGHPVEIKGDKQ